MPKKISIDEVMAKRSNSLKSSAAGDILTRAAMKTPTSWNSEERSARFVMSSQAPDRYGDIVIIEGMDLSNFEKNPVALMSHKSREFPIGNWSDLDTAGRGKSSRLEGTLKFIEPGTIPDADKAAVLVEQGVIRATSVGFIVLDAEWLTDDDNNWLGYQFNETELVECSVVPVPAHPNALVKDAGGDMDLARDMIGYVLDTYVRSPSGLIVSREQYDAAWKKLEDDCGGPDVTIVVNAPAVEPATKDADGETIDADIRVDEDADAIAGDPDRLSIKDFSKTMSDFSAKIGHLLNPKSAPVEGALEDAKALQQEINKTLAVDKAA